MKKLLAVICIFLITALPTGTFADSQSDNADMLEKLENNYTDYQEISQLQEEIINHINVIRTQNGENAIQDDFDIDIDSAVKIYVDTDIFALNTVDETAIMNALNDGTHMWVLDINIGNTTYEVNISKGLPLNEEAIDALTDEEIARIKENEGRWCIAAILISEDTQSDYDQIIKSSMNSISYNTDNIKAVICGGLPYIHEPVAVIMKDNKASLIVPMGEMEVVGTAEQLAEIKPLSAKSTDEVYLYSSIMEAVNHMESEDEYITGGGRIVLPSTNTTQDFDNGSVKIPTQILIIALCVAAAAAFGIIFMLFRKNIRLDNKKH